MTRGRRWLDGKRVAIANHRLHLPKRAADFPKAGIVKDAKILAELHGRWSSCMVCGSVAVQHGAWRQLHLHHIAHGANGRSDEACNLAMLCSLGPDQGCHADVHGGKISLSLLLRCRWIAEKGTTDWVRLAILLRHFLPDIL